MGCGEAVLSIAETFEALMVDPEGVLILRNIVEHAMKTAANPPRDRNGNIRKDWMTALETWIRDRHG